MSAETRLKELGIDLPAPVKPLGAYVPAVRTGQLVFTSGQVPLKGETLVAAGKVPTDVTVEQAQGAARVAVLNALSAVRAQVGSLDAVARIVRMNVFVNSAAGFTSQALVANGASELLGEIFGEAGRHTRCAIGAAELPRNAPVEIDLVVELR
ncbi:MAG: RidA family protein [Planctomycetota bacterium]|nr:RidA family protein [Planctomycetota bacterium]